MIMLDHGLLGGWVVGRFKAGATYWEVQNYRKVFQYFNS